MKKIRICMFTILLTMSMLALTACSSDNNSGRSNNSSGTTQSTTATGSGSGETTTGTTNGTGSSNGTNGRTNNNQEESSTGVIGGMMDDVERGVDDMIDGSDASNASEERR